MAARTTQKSGVASDNTVWDGGTALNDGDSITIAAGHTLTWDVDYSGWTTGIAGLTITSAAGTPGQLTFPTSAGTYYLPIATGASIVGTNAANKGQIRIGSSGSPQPSNAPVTIQLRTTAVITAQYLDIQIYGSGPTTKWVRTLNVEAISSTAIECDTDVSSDWQVNDLINICDVATDEVELRQIASFSGSTINLTAGLTAAKAAGSYVVNITRSAKIHTNQTSHSTQVAMSNMSVAATFSNIELRNTAYTSGTTRMGRGFYQSGMAGHYFSGTASWTSRALEDPSAGWYDMISTGIGAGVASSATYNRVKGIRFTGSVIGASSGGVLGSGIVVESTSLIACCQTGILGEVDLAGTVNACQTGITGTGCTLRRGAVIGGTGADANTTTDIQLTMQGYHGGFYNGFGTSLRSTTQVQNYLGQHDNCPNSSIVLFDVADSGGTPQRGQMSWWSGGGKGASETWVGGTHDPSSNYPGAAPSFIHRSTFETTAARNYVDIPITVQPGATLTATVRMSKQQNSMTATPKCGIVDSDREWGHANEYITSQTMTDNTNVWQQFVLSYQNTGTAPKQVALRVEGKNGSGTMFWNYEFTLGTLVLQSLQCNIQGASVGPVVF